MRHAALLFVLLIVACSDTAKDRPLSEPGERTYGVRGVIEGRDAGDNVLRVKHEEIKGFMAAMTMDFSVRGADVTQLPPDGTNIEATLHVTDRAFWLTGVRRR
jgi:protein SCO1/2